MKIGLYFGSFNPVHTGHLIIANFMAYHTDLDKVWLVVSPHNPLLISLFIVLLKIYSNEYLVKKREVKVVKTAHSKEKQMKKTGE